MDELISIVVPVYNISDYIKKTVDSILAQSYRNIEVILVDDGSTDGSGQLIDKIASVNSNVKVIHKVNGGVTSARLTGVREAKGEWIGFVDGDDTIEPDMYERLINNARKYSAQISHCGYQMVFPNHIDFYHNTQKLIVQNREEALGSLLSGAMIEPGLWNKLYHKSLLQKLLTDNCMDLSIKNTEDLLMNFYLFREASKSVFEDFCPYHYILRTNSATSSAVNEHKLSDPLKVWKIIRGETKEQTELFNIVNRKITENLIRLSVLSAKKNKKIILPIRTAARKELRSGLSDIIHGNYSLKQKISSVWVSVWPWSYSFIHKMYAVISGKNRKYSIR